MKTLVIIAPLIAAIALFAGCGTLFGTRITRVGQGECVVMEKPDAYTVVGHDCTFQKSYK